MSAGRNPRGMLLVVHTQSPLDHDEQWGIAIGWTNQDGQPIFGDQVIFRRGACPVEVAQQLRRLADQISPPQRPDAVPPLPELAP